LSGSPLKKLLGGEELPLSVEDFIANWLDREIVESNRLMLFGLGLYAGPSGKLGIRWSLKIN
jgi:hypothetical protein